MIEDFPEHLRPYTDEQIPAAMQRIAAHRYFPDVAAMIFPGITPAEAISKVLEVKTVYQFQMEWMYAFNKRVIESTMESFTYDFSPGIRPDVGYLYISNHRDIILDTSLLQMIFVDQGLPTSMITYGDNLIVNQLADDLARSNKMFKVVRQGNKRELFKNSVLLSEFLRSCIRQGDSCWIAQRNGRTKDGLDKTAPALVKMMGMSGMRGAAATSDGVAAGGGLNELVENYAALNIVPVAISYEYESCDFLKTKELLAAQNAPDGKTYIKDEDEDLISMITGISQWKGKVHIHVCDPLTREELEACVESAGLGPGEKVVSGGAVRHGGQDFNAFAANLCTLIDSKIWHNYKCFPSNYIAYDLLHGSSTHKHHYSDQNKAAFLKRLEALPQKVFGSNADEALQEALKAAQHIFLKIYANPVRRSAAHS
ncbi:MAG TPA: hypothetical protein PLL74_08280 [Bacteroidales bacterium]|nr:hypothetical protein [Bacteroidales bacterium]HNZ70284.1 hypothetical protein [Prolixibacteraceae bacterium]MDD3521885.1 hypothetical protein [Bacteroidales bacterium]MDD4435814.1 hypothetical protein [Bacteroidales bacterium]HOQ97162.1 hypothetical protein [Bacteroidales bacterium]